MIDKPPGRTPGEPWKEMGIVADITDAMDPQLSQRQRVEAGIRAAQTDPGLAVMCAASIARRLVIDASPGYVGGIPGMMTRIRQVVSATVADTDAGGLL